MVGFVCGRQNYWLLFVVGLYLVAVSSQKGVCQKVLLADTGEGSCDISSGAWLHDESYPLYDWKQCPFIKGAFNCQKFGRPDSDYLKWRWSPSGCPIPRFDGPALLQYLKNQTIMFVGDSLDENQWYSMICLLHATVPTAQTSFLEGNPSQFILPEYGVTVKFHRAQYLVDIVNKNVGGQLHSVLQLDSVAMNSQAWRNANILIFNSGHWWVHTGNKRGYDLIEEGGQYYQQMDPMVAYSKGLATWANWVDDNLDPDTIKAFFRGSSPPHSQCWEYTEPLTDITKAEPYPVQFAVAEAALRNMKYPITYLNVTLLSMLRPDAHPTVYSDFVPPPKREQPEKFSDCSHWCLAGLPDIWNEIFIWKLLSQ